MLRNKSSPLLFVKCISSNHSPAKAGGSSLKGLESFYPSTSAMGGGWIAICLLTLFLFNLEAKMIDEMNSPWNLSYSAGDYEITIEENSNKLKYNFGAGSWVQIYRSNFGEISLSRADAISFYFKGGGEENNLKLQIYDINDNVFERNFSNYLEFNNWQRVVVPFRSLSHWEGTGDGVLDKITKIAFVVTPENGNSGSLCIDEIKLLKVNSTNHFLISSFNYGCSPNEAGGNEGPMSYGGDYDPAVKYIKDSYEGQYSLSLSYDFPGWVWCGYWVYLSSGNASGSFNASNFSYLEFFTKSEQPGRKYKVEFVDSSGDKDEINITDYLTEVTTYWQELKIPTTDFLNVNLDNLKQVNFVFDQEPLSGTVYIDKLRFISEDNGEEEFIEKIDSMDEPFRVSGWENYGRDENKGITSTTLGDVSGVEGDAIKLSYEFLRNPAQQDDWVVMERDWGLNFATHTAMKFRYKGNKSCDLEIKLEDKNGTKFQRKFFGITDTNNEWKTLIIFYEDFSPEGSITSNLDLTKIKGIYITLVKRDDAEGEFFLDDIELIKPDDFSKMSKNKLIKELKIDNNPFSPNGDGIKDAAKFSYELLENAKIKLEIYSLNGEKIWNKEKEEKKGSILWDGKDKNGDSVRNGLYFYKFKAKNSQDEDEIIHLICVLR